MAGTRKFLRKALRSEEGVRRFLNLERGEFVLADLPDCTEGAVVVEFFDSRPVDRAMLDRLVMREWSGWPPLIVLAPGGFTKGAEAYVEDYLDIRLVRAVEV